MADVVLDITSLTLGEMEDFEDACGIPANRLVTMAEGRADVPVKALTALVWIVKRRTDPDYTLEMARAERIDVVAETLGGEPDPTHSNGDANGAGLVSTSASSPNSSGTHRPNTGRSRSKTG